MATSLFDRTMNIDYHNDETAVLMRRVWSVTPWMLNVMTGDCSGARYREIQEWLREHFGPQAHPIHSKPGRWQFGFATVFGETFVGLSTEAEMNEFAAAWPLIIGAR